MGLKPSKELSVLNKRVQKGEKLDREGLESRLTLHSARGDWLEAEWRAQGQYLLAKLATIKRLKRKLRLAGICA